jgi:hypothetical protein
MKDKLALFFLGVFVAWAGLPRLIHLAYWCAILAAFFSGHFAWRH